MKKLLALLLAVLMVLSLVACNGNTSEPATTGGSDAPAETAAKNKPEETAAPQGGDEQGEKGETTLVYGDEAMNGIFNPLFYQTAADYNVIGNIFTALLHMDENAQWDNEGMSDYYEPEVVKNDKGEVEKVIYKYVIKDGITFSDGTPVTTEDVKFTAMAMFDPNFTSPLVTFNTAPLIGGNEYRYDDPNYAQKLEEIKKQAEEFVPNAEELDAFAKKMAPEWKVEEKDLLEGGQYYESDTLPEMRKAKKAELEAAYIKANLEDGKIDVPEIEGIKVISDKEIHFEMSKIDPTSIYRLNFDVLPKHYYAPDFKKGDAPEIEKKNGAPMGAGPYIFKSFKDGVASLEANPKYFKGEPKIKYFKVQEVSKSSALSVVGSGDLDITVPNANPKTMEEAKQFKNISIELVDNNGYGYIGINAKNVPDKNIRKGIMHLIERAPAVQAYYGDLASVIERPLSRVSWAYPKDAKEVYGFSPEKALEYFKKAGYEQKDGKLVRNGEQLKITLGIPGDGTGEHPVYPIFNKMKVEGEKLGMLVDIRDLKGGAFWTALDGQEFDVWCAAWGQTPDPDMTQTYRSDGSSNKGKYNLNNPELDKLIDEARTTMDIETRKQLYAKILDLVMDEAVEMPVYQRKNCYAINNETVNMDTLPEVLTPYAGPLSKIETLEMLK